MFHLIRFVNYSITDVFIAQSEEAGYCSNQFLLELLMNLILITKLSFIETGFRLYSTEVRKY